MRYEWNLDLLSNNNKWEIEYTNLKKTSKLLFN